MLGPVLFNIYLNDLFLFLNKIDICNFANYTTPFVCHENLAKLLENLRETESAIHWFEDNYIKLNTGKCHLLLSGHNNEHP